MDRVNARYGRLRGAGASEGRNGLCGQRDTPRWEGLNGDFA